MKNNVVAAKPGDGEAMLELIESASSKGDIELLYTRRPNAYFSYAREGDVVSIALVKDAKDGIIAQAACVQRDYWLNGERHSAGYVGGIRKKTGCKGLIPWGAVSSFIQETRCDLFYCSFLSDNEEALKLFTKKRPYIPELFPVGEFTTFIINPKSVRSPRGTGAGLGPFTFRPITERDLPQVIAFLNREGQTWQFSPAVTDLLKEFSDLELDDCYMLEYQGDILAFGALWDQRDYKQYIVTKYQGQMILFRMFSAIFEKLGYIAMPRENEVLAFPTLTLFYSKENDPVYYSRFLQEIAQVIRKSYPMFIIGMSSQDPNRQFYEKLRSIHFDSRLFYVKHDADLTLDDRPVRFECGLL